jgi:hypothetical protein
MYRLDNAGVPNSNCPWQTSAAVAVIVCIIPVSGHRQQNRLAVEESEMSKKTAGRSARIIPSSDQSLGEPGRILRLNNCCSKGRKLGSAEMSVEGPGSRQAIDRLAFIGDQERRTNTPGRC